MEKSVRMSDQIQCGQVKVLFNEIRSIIMEKKACMSHTNIQCQYLQYNIGITQHRTALLKTMIYTVNATIKTADYK